MANKIADKEVIGSVVIIAFTNGTTVELDCDQLSEGMQAQGLYHGIKQKLGDSYAGAKSIEEAIAACTGVANALMDDTWNAGRDASGDLVTALVEQTGQPLETVVSKLSGMTKEEKADIRKHPALKVILTRIAAERAAEKAIDAPELNF